MRRRIELDPRYSNRHLFAAERGIGYRTVSDIERSRRDNYEDTTIMAVEVAYHVAPGSVERALAGGDLEPLPGLRPAPVRPRPAAPFPADATLKDEVAEEVLAELLRRYADDAVVRVMGAQRGKEAGTRVVEILRFLKDPDLDREVLAGLMSRDDEVIRTIGAQRGKRELMRITEIFGFTGWRPPEMAAGSGTAG